MADKMIDEIFEATKRRFYRDRKTLYDAAYNTVNDKFVTDAEVVRFANVLKAAGFDSTEEVPKRSSEAKAMVIRTVRLHLREENPNLAAVDDQRGTSKSGFSRPSH